MLTTTLWTVYSNSINMLALTHDQASVGCLVLQTHSHNQLTVFIKLSDRLAKEGGADSKKFAGDIPIKYLRGIPKRIYNAAGVNR